jgi:SAM-dependent methyltransferase
LAGKRVLDVGCGTGAFLEECVRRGATVWGVDFDARAVAAARERLGSDGERIVCRDFETFFADDTLPLFDYVGVFDVLEHVPRPGVLLSAVRRRLAPKGVVIITVPNRERVFVNGSSWDFPPHHLSRWDRRTLRRELARQRMMVADLATTDGFLVLRAAFNERFATGVVRRVAAQATPAAPRRDQLVHMVRALDMLGRIKGYVVGGIPAALALGWSRLRGRTNGNLYVEAMRDA